MTEPPPTSPRTAWGWGLATVHATGTLDTYFPDPRVDGELTDPPADLVGGRDL